MGVFLVIVLPAIVVVVLGILLAQAVVRTAPFPSPASPDLTCPFCGNRMQHGRIMHSGYPLWWQPSGAPRPRVWMARPGSHPTRGALAVFEAARVKPRVRGASVCANCEAVVIDPKG